MNISNLLERIERKICEDRVRKKFYSQLINENDLVFDIGANIGNRTSVFINLGAKVIAVEPNPRLAKKLKKKFKKAKVINKAIGENETKVVLYLNETNVLSSTSKEWVEAVKDSGRFGELGWKFNEQIEVEQTTITSLIKDYGVPKFVKIDTEGTEYEIVRKLENNDVDVISLEFAIPENKSNLLKIVNHLSSIGYAFYNFSFGESLEFISTRKFNINAAINLINTLPEYSWGDVYAYRN